MVVALVIVSVLVGIPLDARGPEWGQAALGVWNWAALGFILWSSDRRHRWELVAAVIFATLGELFLGFAWGLYDYRLGNLPAFIPPGHAMVFAAGVRLARQAPEWLPWLVVGLMGPYIAWAAWSGIDTSGALWFAVFLGFLAWGRDRRLYAVMFVLALAIEIWGTSLGGWWYFEELPHVGLTSTNPPSCAGVFYCVLDMLVLVSTRRVAALARPGA